MKYKVMVHTNNAGGQEFEFESQEAFLKTLEEWILLGWFRKGSRIYPWHTVFMIDTPTDSVRAQR